MTIQPAPRTTNPAEDAPSSTAVVTYEYSTVRVPRDLQPLSEDTYRSLGWIVSANERSSSVFDVPGAASLSPTVALQLKRGRGIPNRRPLQALQRTAEASLSAIARLERSVSTFAIGVAAAFGIAGSAALAGSVVLLPDGPLVWSIVLGALGLLLWLGGSMSHSIVRRRRERTVAPLVDREQDVLDDVAEQAAELLR